MNKIELAIDSPVFFSKNQKTEKRLVKVTYLAVFFTMKYRENITNETLSHF